MINNVVLVGRITKDIDLRKSQQNISVTGFTLAVDKGYKVPDGQPTADFIQCIAWRQGADFLAQYAVKGDMVGVVGSIATRNYDDKDGKKVYVTEVVANKVRLYSKRKEETQGNVTSNEPAMESQVDIPSQDVGSGSLDISSDDLPFY